MTDHFDELASAYLDGQADPDERARVDADPELGARVEELGRIAGQLASQDAPVDSVRRRRQINAALDAFEALGSFEVVAAASAVPALAPPDGAPAGGAARTNVVALDRRRAGLPRWLSAAALLVVVGGGVAYVASSRPGSSDDTSTAAVATEEASPKVAESSADAGPAADSAAVAPASPPSTIPSTSAERATGDATSAGGTESLDSQAAAGDPAPSTTTFSSTTAASATKVERFTAVPTEAQVLARLDAGAELSPPRSSQCGSLVTGPNGKTLTGVLAVNVDGELGEALVYGPSSGTTSGNSSGLSVVLVTSECLPYG